MSHDLGKLLLSYVTDSKHSYAFLDECVWHTISKNLLVGMLLYPVFTLTSDYFTNTNSEWHKENTKKGLVLEKYKMETTFSIGHLS